MDSSASKSAGRLTSGLARGRKPRVVETMKAGSVVSVGRVSVRMGKVGFVVVGAMMIDRWWMKSFSSCGIDNYGVVLMV